MENKTIKVEGMSCEHCVKAVTEAISGLAGVENVNVELKAGTASFSFDASKCSLTQIEAAVEEAGFAVGAS